MKVGVVLFEGNYQLIKKIEYFEKLQVDEAEMIQLNPKP